MLNYKLKTWTYRMCVVAEITWWNYRSHTV